MLVSRARNYTTDRADTRWSTGDERIGRSDPDLGIEGRRADLHPGLGQCHRRC